MAHLCLSLQTLLQSDRYRVVTTCEDRLTTAAELHERVALLSRALSLHLSVSQGDRAVLIGLNTDYFFSTFLSVLDAGAVACPLNWRWSAAELSAAITLLQPKVVFADEQCMALAMQACRHGSASWTVVSMGHSTQDTAATSPLPAFVTQHLSISELLTKAQASVATGSSSSCTKASAAPPAATDVPSHSQQILPLQSPPCGVQGSPQAVAAQHGAHRTNSSPSKSCSELQLQLLQPGAGQPALIVFTSGTTGASKGVMLSHDSLVHQSMAKLAVVGYTRDDIYLHMAPLFHIGGLSSAFAVLLAGGSHVFMPRYSPSTALQLIQQHSVTSLIAVPAMMQDITQAAAAGELSQPPTAHPAQGPAADATAQTDIKTWQSPRQQQQLLTSLQRVLVGAGGMSLRLQHAVANLFPAAVLQTAYGMTEASSSITFIAVPQQQQLMATAAAVRAASTDMAATGAAAALKQQALPAAAGVCVGRPGPGIAVQIDTAAIGSSSSLQNKHPNKHQKQQQQQWAEAGTVGEVCTRGPHVMLGYWHDAEATSKALSLDGWLHTGDLGYLDNSGNLWLVGRLKDMVKTGGENVHAAEVEAVLLSHPAVAAAAVFGLEHERLGEQVAAAVVLQPPWGWADAATLLPGPQQQQQQQHVLSPADLQQHCRAALLSPYKLPRVLVCVKQLPLNSSGKVVKAVLKEQVQQQMAAGALSHGSESSSCQGGGSTAGRAGGRQQETAGGQLQRWRSKL